VKRERSLRPSEYKLRRRGGEEREGVRVTCLETRSFFSSDTAGEGSGGGITVDRSKGGPVSPAQPREESLRRVDFTTLVSKPLEAIEPAGLKPELSRKASSTT
jgi:hypothetical protein